MPILVAWILNGLRILLFTQGGRIIVGILSWLGLSLATHAFAMGPALSFFQSQMASGPGSGIGALALQWLGVLRFDQAVSMLISAWTIKVSIDAAKISLSKVL